MATIVLLVLSNIYWFTQVSALYTSQQEINRILDDHGDVLTLIGEGEARRIDLLSADGEARAIMLCNPEEELGFLYVEDFPPLASGRAYQLWLVRGEERTNAGLFTVDEHGEGTLVFRVDEPVGQYDSVEITTEPNNGSAQPTSPTLVSGVLSY